MTASDGMVALVTGGGRGIGRATALALASMGAHAVVSSRSRSELDETARVILASGGTSEALPGDLSRPEECQRVVHHVLDRHGKVDVLVHCAGFTPAVGPVEETSFADFQRAMDTNVGALFWLSKVLVPAMRSRNQGMIIAMSSGCGLKGHPGLTAYSASKFAVQGLVQAIARELEGTSVVVVAMNPGGVDTRMLVDLFGAEESARNQSPDVVAAVVRQVVQGTLHVPNGGGVTVRRGEVGVYFPPGRWGAAE